MRDKLNCIDCEAIIHPHQWPFCTPCGVEEQAFSDKVLAAYNELDAECVSTYLTSVVKDGEEQS